MGVDSTSSLKKNWHFPHPYWAELTDYLAEQEVLVNSEWFNSFDGKVKEELSRYNDAETFYRETYVYLYQNLAFFLDGYKRPYYAALLKMAGTDPVTIMDYGCGAGYDGQLFLQIGYNVSFVDVESRSLPFLRWRLDKHNLSARIGVLNTKSGVETGPPQHDFVWCIDVLEHLPPEHHKDFILQLEGMGRTVVMTLVCDKQADGVLHYPVEVHTLTEWVRNRRRAWMHTYHEQPDGSCVRLLVIGERADRLYL